MKSAIFILVVSVALYAVPSQCVGPATPVASTAPTATAVPSTTVTPTIPAAPAATAYPAVNTPFTAPTQAMLNRLTPEQRQMYDFLQQQMTGNVGVGVNGAGVNGEANLPLSSPFSFLRNSGLSSLGFDGMRDFAQNFDTPITTGAINGLGTINKQIGKNIEYTGEHLQNIGDTVNRFNGQVERGFQAIPLGLGAIPAGIMNLARSPRLVKRLGRYAGEKGANVGGAFENLGQNMRDYAELSRAQASLQRKDSRVQQLLEDQRLRAAQNQEAQAQGQFNGFF